MGIDRENIMKRVEQLIERGEKGADDFSGVGELISGTINILETLYGPNSHKCKSYVEQSDAHLQQQNRRPHLFEMVKSTIGTLKSIKSEVETGLIGSLELQAQGWIFGDFITLAKKSLDASKDVAAVLVSAAIEDTLKRFALQNGLNVADADMPEVINALKSKGLLKGPQASLVQSYVQLRNKAFHAEWDKIEKETVNSAISFTETFLLEHFS
jgi:uncharacterized protein YutE (UPF0331/DUF86 family)